MSKALILTNHLHAWAGSEILALEASEVLSKKYNVTLVANLVAKEMYNIADRIGFSIINDPTQIELRDYEFIWSQHFVAPLCKGFENLDEFSGSFNSIHLSPYFPFELASLTYTKPIGANIVANSLETKEKINSLYTNDLIIHNLNNATLPSFSVFKDSYPVLKQKPKNVLIVSNHIPQEIVEASSLLVSKGISINAFGEGQKNYKRVTRNDIHKSDVIITIGKTVQYGILARRTVYCYDRFGGPGYITPKNAQDALNKNFSGRCCNRKISPNEICDEIFNHFSQATKNVDVLYEMFHEKFNLVKFIENLSNQKTKLNSKENDLGPIIETSKLIRQLYMTGVYKP